MKFQKVLLGIFLFLFAVAGRANATERIFTYTYEPETMPQGGWEFENWVTARRHNVWDFRQELEYGVTDNYLLSFYLNEKVDDGSEFEGISLENKFLVLDPATHPVGLALYLEPRFAAHETELEEKIILGQRSGDWKWALNLTHATEWKKEDGESETDGELEVTFGLAKQVSKKWSIGAELRDHNEIEGYKVWKHSSFFAGPAVNYKGGDWWVTVTALGGQGVNVRCIVGIEF